MKTKVYDILKEEVARIVMDKALEVEVVIKTAVLSSKEAIGNPEDKHYPLIVQKERIIQANFSNSLCQAFTDMYSNFSGELSKIATMELKNDLRRAIFVSSLNAVMRYLGLIAKTTHCRNEKPRLCGYKLAKYIEETYAHPRVAMGCFHPSLLRRCLKS